MDKKDLFIIIGTLLGVMFLIGYLSVDKDQESDSSVAVAYESISGTLESKENSVIQINYGGEILSFFLTTETKYQEIDMDDIINVSPKDIAIEDIKLGDTVSVQTKAKDKDLVAYLVVIR